MPPAGKNSKNTNNSNLDLINRQIFEIKKKIQLSEGQRKAYYEECDTEKRRNMEKIRALKKSVKQLYLQLGKPPTCDTVILRTTGKLTKEMMPLRNKHYEEAATLLDLKVIDLQKKLDLIRHRTKKSQSRMKELADEYQDLTSDTTEEMLTKKFDSSDKTIAMLENQIHRVEMNIMETNHMRTKYLHIRSGLLTDSIKFECTLQDLEKSVIKQESEIKHLEEINREAMELRDTTKRILMRQEVMVMNVGKARDREQQQLRSRVEERKADLERLERRIFQSGRPVVHQDSASTESPRGQQHEMSNAMESLEKSFNILKEATGVTENEEVLHRFLSQIETKNRLTYLKDTNDTEKKQLEKRRDMLMAELEAFKFAQVKESDQNEEELERLKLAIVSATETKAQLIEETEDINNRILMIKNELHSFCLKMRDVDSSPVPDFNNNVDDTENLLMLLKDKLTSLLNRIDNVERLELAGGSEKLTRLLGEEESSVFPDVVEPQPDKSSEPEEDDDVPTRGFLKRQAQVIVDAKSKKKSFRVTTATKDFGKYK